MADAAYRPKRRKPTPSVVQYWWRVPPCPVCLALSGNPCRTRSGYVTRPHRARLALAEAIRK